MPFLLDLIKTWFFHSYFKEQSTCAISEYMPIIALRTHEMNQLPQIIRKNPFVIIQWCSSRFVPCNVQLSQLRNKQFEFPIVSIDVDQNPEAVEKMMDKYQVAPIFPAVSIFKFSKNMPVSLPHFYGSASIKQSKHFYGQNAPILIPLIENMYKDLWK